MSDKKPNNPPAFPCTKSAVNDLTGEYFKYDSPGMALRDYFAGKVLQGELASQGSDYTVAPNIQDAVAEKCYKLADAMLKAREL